MHLRNLEVCKPLELRTSKSRNLEREARGQEIASQARHSDRAEHVATPVTR